ncbi:MAG: protein translocase subunit SecD, partial [Akkermansiaceae bacterium]|nr:protein translocase subunit SecD [Akkermansiaceae bacterium]
MTNPYLVFFSGLAVLGLLFWYFATDVDRRKRNVGSLLVASVIALSVWALVPPSEKLKPGIDLAGGSAFTVEVQPKLGEDGVPIPVSPTAVDKAIETLQGRLNPKGEKDLLIQRQGTNRIIIEMPGIEEDEAESVRRRIKETARLELRAVHPQSSFEAPRVAAGEAAVPGYQLFDHEYETDDGEKRSEQLLLSKRVQVEGKHVQSAAADPGQRGVTNIRLTGDGGDRMIRLTQDMAPGRDRIAVVLDGEVLSAPVVQSVPLGRDFLIEGLDSYEEADDLAASLMNPLENPLEILEDREVSPRLGKATIQQGIYAGIAGLGLTLIFVLIYYRIAGMIALAGLMVNIVILFGAMAMFGFTFTLPGIAGIILTIGVAVDANVLIYERLREELKLGKSVRAAIQAAYEKAFSAIFDANITTLITALILFWRASGTVKGVAGTLTIGILASMFAALVATRVLFWWSTDKKILKKLNFLNLVPDK